MALTYTDTTGYGLIATCPQCGGDATHIDAVDIQSAGGQQLRASAEGEDSAAYIDLRVGKGSGRGMRRHAISLTLECEHCGQYTVVRFLQHKGTTIVSSTTGPIA